MRWKIKRFSNDELRQKFIDATVPQGHYLGLTFPDPELKLRRGKRALEFGAIDWSEFKRVLAGERPVQPPAHADTRAKAHEDGAWVREAALAHAREARERAAGPVRLSK